MKYYRIGLSVAFAMLTLGLSNASAQSSGSFNASGTNAACAIGDGGSLTGGAAKNLLTTTVQTSSGTGVTLLVRPNLVTGLFTDTKISGDTVSTANADVGIQVCLKIDGKTDGILSAPCIVYDQRFQQISSNLFSTIAGIAGQTTCTDPTTGLPCYFDLIQSTLSAHSYDFVAQVPQGNHTLTATWSVIGQGATPGSRVASCVGPGVLTVTQTKNFTQNGTLSF